MEGFPPDIHLHYKIIFSSYRLQKIISVFISYDNFTLANWRDRTSLHNKSLPPSLGSIYQEVNVFNK